ncbi:MAG: tRNA (adenosine(37)-N6)-threonylcarbamoyltransferase complex transferase subunit TsaD, partial [Deltaproteobacteria bacterium]|nr:tRNA (adenosine(37)-N6)-threonylcarbamoyltransferase complex transferase subunit TsaD [Deltaproteobacteria bacterium]
SCDETAAAVSMDGSIISSQISTQTIHQKYGGVVPEIASREHEKLLNDMVSDTLKDAKISPQELEGIAVTQGPGLSGTLITGICFAKGLALGLGLPIIGVNHLEAHIFANFLADPALKFPFVCLLVSGGHTQLWHVKDVNDYSMLGESRDDAAGEAFDKGARILGLGYPGGPEIEKLSISGNRNAIKFPRALMKKGNLEFSFSGLKTSLLYYMDSHKNENMNDVAASYQQAIVDVLITKLKWAMKKTDCITCVIAGGVAANRSLRKNVELMLAT